MNIEPCPFCGNILENKPDRFWFVDSMKWGAVKCGCGASGPDVRTNYKNNENEEWHIDAIEEWNKRIKK